MSGFCRAVLIILLFLSADLSVFAGELQPTNANDALNSEGFDIVAAVRIKPPVTFCGETVPVNDEDVRERIETELLLMAWDRAQTVLWMKRAGRFFPHIEKTLKAKGLPDDLKYIAVIESSLRAGVNSSAGASGFWQFIEATGKKYGLDVNPLVDQRRNLSLSTDAATQYLSGLHSMLGSWFLASAAYNMGEFGLKERIEMQETRDYFNLYLPPETMRYVPRAIAVKMIFSDPKKFGLNLAPEDLYKPVDADQIQISCPYRINVMLIAKAAKTYYKTIRDLNPEIKGSFMDKGQYRIMLPKGSLSGFNARFTAVLNDNNLLHLYGMRKTHVVKAGESLSNLAARYGVRPETLMKWSALESDDITPGMKITIYSRI